MHVSDARRDLRCVERQRSEEPTEGVPLGAASLIDGCCSLAESPVGTGGGRRPPDFFLLFRRRSYRSSHGNLGLDRRLRIRSR